ncbi:MAG: ABC transporter permease [Spirochaetales bacterium]|nr:ABC transporter permease [Spirochaetales bacterium]
MIRDITASLGIELLKIRKSLIFIITIGISVFISAIMGMFMYFIMHPDILPPGLLKTKVDLAAVSADWPSYFGFLEMIIGILGIILFGFVVAWIFGREYSDKTVKDILALPSSRTSIVISKLLATAVWSLLISVIIIATGLLAGFIIKLPLWSEQALFDYIRICVTTALLSLLLAPPAAFIASAGHGYLAPVGFVIGCMGFANLFGNIGLGPYFPWAVPMLYAGAVEGPGSELSAASYVILVTTCLAGTIGTIAWWKYADQY